MTVPIPFAGCFGQNPEARLVFVGVPDDTQSTFLRGPAAGPSAIRSAYDGNCFNATTEAGVDLTGLARDAGDVEPGGGWAESAARYTNAFGEILDAGKIPFAAGGDHAVTIPLVAAFSSHPRPIHVIQIDAHPDLYDDFEGNRYSHACTGARILEMDHVSSLTQFGIRTLSAAQQPTVDKYGDRLAIHHARETPGALPAALPQLGSEADVYLTIDMDGFDPAFAPGVSHAVPGGLTSRQVLDWMHRAEWNLVGMDVVEVNPGRDRDGQTAILAGRLLHEGMGYALSR